MSRKRKRSISISQWKNIYRKKEVTAGKEHMSSSKSKTIVPGEMEKERFPAGCRHCCNYHIQYEI